MPKLSPTVLNQALEVVHRSFLYFPLVGPRRGGAAVMSDSLLDVGSAALCILLLPVGISI